MYVGSEVGIPPYVHFEFIGNYYSIETTFGRPGTIPVAIRVNEYRYGVSKKEGLFINNIAGVKLKPYAIAGELVCFGYKVGVWLR